MPISFFFVACSEDVEVWVFHVDSDVAMSRQRFVWKYVATGFVRDVEEQAFIPPRERLARQEFPPG